MKLIGISTLLCIVICHSVAAVAGSIPLMDTFDDGDASDGNPESWTGTFTVENGDLVLSGNDLIATAVAGTEDIRDVTLRTQFRILDPGGPGGVFVALFARSNSPSAYWGGVRFRETVMDLVLGEQRDGQTPERGRTSYTFDPTKQDIMMEMDVRSDELFTHVSLRAWPEGGIMPESPQLSFTDTADDELAPGSIGLLINRGTGNPKVAFRSFEAIPVPESTSFTLIGLGALVVLWSRPRFR